MKAALNMNPPNWDTALEIWEYWIDYAISNSASVQPRMSAARRELDRLYQALQAKDMTTVDAMTSWIVKDLQSLSSAAAAAG